MRSLNNATTADAYPADNAGGAQVRGSGVVRVQLDVSNAAVFYQLLEPVEGQSEASWNWGQEAFQAPATASLTRRTAGIRFRSAVAGTPAQVTALLLTPLDLGGE